MGVGGSAWRTAAPCALHQLLKTAVLSDGSGRTSGFAPDESRPLALFAGILGSLDLRAELKRLSAT